MSVAVAANDPNPARVDADGDGIYDVIDKCPTQAETHNGFEDDDGCPDNLPPRTCPYSLPPQVFFLTQGQTTIEQKQIKTLVDLAKTMKGNPDYRLEVRGHSSLDEGSDEGSRFALGMDRARSVRDYLVIKEDISADRIVLQSFGSAAPFPCGHGEIDIRDRRVELRIIFAEVQKMP